MSIFTPVDEAELRAFLANYSVGELVSSKGIVEGVENTNYFVTTTQGEYVLTLVESLDFDRSSEVQDFVVFLAAHQIKVAGPIKSNSGDVTLKLNGRPAVLSCRLKGSPVDIPSITQCHVIGEELGRSHRKSVDHSYLRKKNVIDWCVSCADALGNALSNEDQKLVNSVLKTFKNIPWYKLPAGPIHADLFPDNALFVDDELQGVIDFYHSCDAPFIFDLAVMLNAWCYSESVGCFYPVKEMTILDAYQSQRKLSPIELEWLTAVRVVAAMRFWLSRETAHSQTKDRELVTTKDPQGLKKLLISLLDRS